jgi:predicted DNA-binding transcriptional regulator AlpA
MENTLAQRRAPKLAIRLPRVCDHTASPPATVWRWSKYDPTFPKPFRLSAGVTCWDEGEILDWIEAKKAQRGA